MNRRQMVILPGIALVASRAFSQTQSAAPAAPASVTLSKKKLARYSGLKSFYTVPKSAAKQGKYISFLTTLLGLTPSQQTQAASIFASATTAYSTLKQSMKAARRTLAESVQYNDTNGIANATASIGTLVAQHYSIGASTQAALVQTLTFAQRTTLLQSRN